MRAPTPHPSVHASTTWTCPDDREEDQDKDDRENQEEDGDSDNEAVDPTEHSLPDHDKKPLKGMLTQKWNFFVSERLSICITCVKSVILFFI